MMTSSVFVPGAKNRQSQQGVTLVVAMIMLMLITIIGFSAMQTTTMQTRMSGNLRDKTTSFQAAEAALREQEAWLAQSVTLPDLPDNPVEYGTDGNRDLSAVSTDPTTTLEEKYFVPDSLDIGHDPQKGRDLYRLEATGTGQSENSQTRLESIYAKRFN